MASKTPDKTTKKPVARPRGGKSHLGVLSDAQRRFAREYILDTNATQAAIRAGYSAKSADQMGPRQLKNPLVAELIAELQAKLAEKLDLSAAKVLTELSAIAFSDVRDAVKWWMEDAVDTKGKVTGRRPSITFHDSDTLDKRTAAAISEVGVDAKGNLKIKFHDKVASLEKLGKHLGLFTERVEITQPIRFIIEDAPPIKY